MQSDTNLYLISILSLTGGGLLFSAFRLFGRETPNYSSFLLNLLIFSLSLFVFSIGLTYTGFYLRFPHFWRLFTALGYLNSPMCLLFFRVILTNRQEFKRTDLWVGVPALIHIVNMLPFILSDRDAKIEAVKAVMIDGNAFIMEIEGFLLPGLNSWLRAFIAISMLIGQMLLLAGAAHHFTKGEGNKELQDRFLYRWLWIFTIVVSISTLLVLLQFVINILPGWDMMRFIPLPSSLILLYVIGSLLMMPERLKGFRNPLSRSELFF